jgi:hypothetical protein
MGWHDCIYCKPGQKNEYINTSSGDIILKFASDNIWQVPDMILHYMRDHGWMPPPDFINDVLYSNLTGGSRYQTRSAGGDYFRLEVGAEPIGYLTQNFISTPVPYYLVQKLETLMVSINTRSGYGNVIYKVSDQNKPACR